jgi:polyisoprenoid-binding protein YceI
MTKTSKLAAMLLTGSLLFSGCAKDPAKDVPSANVSSTPVAQSTTTPAARPAATPAEGTVYAFAKGSEVGFVGSKVTGSHDGGFKMVNGSVTVPGENLDQATVDLNIDMNSIYSDDEKLTTHLKSDDFFDIANNPTSTFKSSSIAKTDEGYNVSGDLTLRGVTKAITFPAQISMEGDVVTTKAEFSINRKDFNIVYKGKPDNLIRDDVVIKFDIKADKQGA